MVPAANFVKGHKAMTTTMRNFSGPFARSPANGAKVKGRIYIPSCIPGGPPLFDYTFQGTFIGECADGFMVKPDWRSDGGDLGTIFCRVVHEVAGNDKSP